ncbi:MAG: hypothetical protein ACRC5W_10705 [Cetobacterium sp.]
MSSSNIGIISNQSYRIIPNSFSIIKVNDPCTIVFLPPYQNDSSTITIMNYSLTGANIDIRYNNNTTAYTLAQNELVTFTYSNISTNTLNNWFITNKSSNSNTTNYKIIQSQLDSTTIDAGLSFSCPSVTSEIFYEGIADAPQDTQRGMVLFYSNSGTTRAIKGINDHIDLFYHTPGKNIIAGCINLTGGASYQYCFGDGSYYIIYDNSLSTDKLSIQSVDGVGFSAKRIKNIATPTAQFDASTKGYVDAKYSNFQYTSGTLSTNQTLNITFTTPLTVSSIMISVLAYTVNFSTSQATQVILRPGTGFGYNFICPSSYTGNTIAGSLRCTVGTFTSASISITTTITAACTGYTILINS